MQVKDMTVEEFKAAIRETVEDVLQDMLSSRAKLFVYIDSHCRVRALRAALRVRNAPQPINTSDRIERISN